MACYLLILFFFGKFLLKRHTIFKIGGTDNFDGEIIGMLVNDKGFYWTFLLRIVEVLSIRAFLLDISIGNREVLSIRALLLDISIGNPEVLSIRALLLICNTGTKETRQIKSASFFIVF
ncbi:hypothetical protein BABA_25106 [Neobacillus bataviensis LMG 21833]|uniref:Uncharacterized protein n=1 Tax=Neobacillus bataviensis LMG 21833 TaxID=1117379 RepID=K6DPF3_9BACI|nr:hypothetical protein BABA_25106 [Neobacillus bataviensis LMG 21833]